MPGGAGVPLATRLGAAQARSAEQQGSTLSLFFPGTAPIERGERRRGGTNARQLRDVEKVFELVLLVDEKPGDAEFFKGQRVVPSCARQTDL